MRVLGIVFDTYTPAVEAQLTRDLIALKSSFPQEEIKIALDLSFADALFSALGVTRDPEAKPDLYIVYKVSEFWPEYPDERDHTVVLRDLYVSEDYVTINTEPDVGYYLKPQGRPIRDTVNLDRMGPKGRGAIDPAILLVWGN